MSAPPSLALTIVLNGGAMTVKVAPLRGRLQAESRQPLTTAHVGIRHISASTSADSFAGLVCGRRDRSARSPMPYPP